MIAPINEKLARLIDTTLTLPAFPVVAQKALAAVNRPETTPRDLADLIGRDQGITTDLLRTMNSPFYRRRAAPKTVEQAVVFLGMKAMRLLIISAASKTLYNKRGHFAEALWAHGMGAALACRLIAEATSLPNSEEAFVAGLLHDVGKPVMAFAAPDQFELSLHGVRSEGLTSMQAEYAVFGYSHTDVGALLLERWNLSDSLASAALLHHDIDLARTIAPDSIKLVCAVSLADAICHSLGIGALNAVTELDVSAAPGARELGLSEQQLSSLVHSVDASFDEERALLRPD